VACWNIMFIFELGTIVVNIGVCTNPGRQVALATKSVRLLANIIESSESVTFPARRILRWLLDLWEMCELRPVV
jgi:hypothetical protein